MVRSPISRISSSGGYHTTRRRRNEQAEPNSARDARTHLGAHLQLYNLDLVCDDWGFGALVEGGVEHFDSVGMELVREAGPLERKGHCGEGRETNAALAETGLDL